MILPLSDLHVRLHKGIRSRHLLHPKQRILVAVSGGQDSLCLLQLLSDLASRWQWQLHVLHCDHRWSDDETRCAQFLAEWIPATYGIPCQVATATNITRHEDGARRWRYQQLQDWAEHWGCTAIVTAHTGTDKAETFLLHLMRGSGSQGLTSLTWQRPLTRDPQGGSIMLVRPMLQIWRQETGSFCQQHALPVWPDQSNDNLRYARNRLRHTVMPLLREHFNPQVEQALWRAADLIEAEHNWIQAQATALWPQIFERDPPRLHQSRLASQPLPLQRACLYRFLAELLPHTPRFEQVEEAHRLLNAPPRTRTGSLGCHLWLEVREGYITACNSSITTPSGSAKNATSNT